jgi:hypothetical protein
MRGRYGDSIEPDEFHQFVLDKRDVNVGYGVPKTKPVTPVYGTRTAYDPEYGQYQERYVTGYQDESGNAVDQSSLIAIDDSGWEEAPGSRYRYEMPVDQPTYSSLNGVVGKLTSQILSQGTTGKWGGEGYGSAQKSAADMALLLTAAGLTDINQFGMVDKLEPVEQIGFTLDGNTVQNPSPGMFYVNEYLPDNEYGYYQTRRDLTPEEAQRVKPVYGVFTGNDPEGYGPQYEPVDASTVTTKDGKLVGVTGQVYGNKATGEPINAYYDKASGNTWSGTFAGEGSTAYGVQFTPDGTPVFYTQYGGSSNDFANLMADLGPIAQIGLAIATGGLSIPQQIAAQMAVQVLSGKDVDDAIKSAAISLAVAQIPGMDVMKEGASYLNGIDSSGVLARSFQTAATSAAKAVLTGEDISDALLSGAVSGGVSGAVDFMAKGIDGFENLSSAEKAAAKTAMTSIISGKPLDQVLINTAISAANAQIKIEKDNKSAKDAGWADYATQQAAKLTYGNNVTPDLYTDKQETTEAEAKDIARGILGREPTEFEYMQLIGLPENEATQNSDLAAIKYDESTFDSNELAETYKSVYGKEPTKEWLESDEAYDLLGRSDAQGKNMLQNLHVQDKNTTNNTEAEAFWKEMGNTGPIPAETLFQMLSMPESGAKALSEDLGNTTAEEATAFLRQFYGSSYQPTEEQLATLVGKRPEASVFSDVQNLYTKDKNWVTEDEAQQFWKDTGNTGPVPQEFMDSMLMTSEDGARAMAETHRINAEDIAATTFDGSQYKTPQEAAAAAKAAGFNAFTHKDKNLTYFTQPSPVQEAEARANVEEKKTFNEAFAAARKELGAGKTFTWNGKQYTTNVMPKDTFDASRSSTITTAATLALANGKDKFIGPDGKTYKLDDNAKSVLANSVNESPAETQRLLRQAIKPATDETAAETQRLMESGTRGTMDTVGAMAAQALGTTQRGFGQFLSNAGKTYAAITGDLDFDNALIKIGKEVESYAKGSDIYGLDVQKNRLSQAMARANETDNWIEKTKILGSAISKNSIGFFDVAGSEVVEELPETILQIGAALMTGGTTLAAKGAVVAIGAAGSVMETFGGTVEDTYKQAKKAGFSDKEAMDKAYINGALSTAIEVGTNFVADKALLAPFLNKFTGTLAGTATGFVSSTAIGAASNLVAGLSQSYATQYLINPETASLSKAATDGIFEMFIGTAAQGGMGLPGYAIQGGVIIGKDYSGKDLTVADVAAGAVLDSSTVNPNATIATSEDGDPVTLGGAMLQMPNYQFDMSTLKTYVPQVFQNDNLIVGQDEFGNNVTFGDLMGQTTESKGFDAVYKSLLDITPQQRAERTTSDANTSEVVPEVVPEVIPEVVPDGTFTIDAAPPTFEELIRELEPAAVVSNLPSSSTQTEARDIVEDFQPDSSPPRRSVWGRRPRSPAVIAPVTPEPVAELPAVISSDTTTGTDGTGTVTDDTVTDNVGTGTVTNNTGTAVDIDSSNVTPIGATPTDVGNAIDSYMAANPGLSKTDVTNAVADYMTANPGLTASDLSSAISTATKDLATTEQVGDVQEDVDALGKLIGAPGADDAAGTGIIGQLEAMGLTDSQILGVVGKPATETDPATGLYKSAEDAAVRGENAAAAVQRELSSIIGAPSVKDDPATLDVDEALAATGLYGQIEASQAETAGAIGELAKDVQDKFDALTAEQKVIATNLQQQGVDLNKAIETAKAETQQQITDLGVEVDARINELMQQGQTYQQATQQAFAEVNAKNQEMAGLIGTQGRTANQSDIDALTEMLGGQRSMDLAYDVTGDKQITQADIDFLTQVVGGTKTDWTAPVGSAFGPTGLYGQLATNEQRRQQDLAAAEAQRVADQQAAAQAAAERDRQANIRTTATRAQTSAQGIMQQLEAMQRAGMAPQQPAQLVEAGPGFDVSAALNTGFFSGFQAKKAQQNQQPTTKIAAGGYIDDLLAGDLSVDELLDLLR